MPNPTKAGRRAAWFEDGELWCADDATPPVSPAGWYVRPRGRTAVWIGPFATAEAAEATPGGDPLAAARRQLDAWARDRPAAAAAPATTAGAGGPAGEGCAGARPRRDHRPSSRRGPREPTLPDPGRAAAGVGGQPTCPPRGPPPEAGLSRGERGRAGGASRPPDAPTAPRQLAFGFGPDAGGPPTPAEGGDDARPARRGRSSRRRGRAPGVQEALPF